MVFDRLSGSKLHVTWKMTDDDLARHFVQVFFNDMLRTTGKRVWDIVFKCGVLQTCPLYIVQPDRSYSATGHPSAIR